MKKTLLVQAMAATLACAPLAAFADEAALERRVEQLAAELEKLKAELAAAKQKTDSVEKRQEAIASAPAPAPAPVPAPVASAASEGAPRTVVTSYGEINYNRPTKDGSQAQADVRRAVIGIEHRFDEQNKMVAEFEWEHAVASADDEGETEVEQLYVEHEFGNGMHGKAGLFLMPAGLLNANHEPTAYYGVERNFVETAIIPSTWREAGIGLSSSYDSGWSWDAGVTTGFDLTKWDAASDEGRESPLGSIHQEGQLAKSHDLSIHGALNWRGVPGLLLGGFVFTGKAGHNTDSYAANDARITLWDLHGRYTPGAWDLSAVYTRGSISNTDALNLTFAGNPTPVPSSFYGWYGQAAYQLLKTSGYTLSPFVRYEKFNTANGYSAMPAGLEFETAPAERVVTAGANFRIGEGIVLKADYQKFHEDTSRNRFNLGVGYSF